MTPVLPPRLNGLLASAAYPHSTARIELIQTPISWVILTGDWAYKIKRPIQLPFADFRLLERRAFLCREEVRLNRRFAPDIYCDVCPITAKSGLARIGGDGEVVDHAVRMRQFSQADQLDRLLAAHSIDPVCLREFGASLSGIHATLPAATDSHPWGELRQTSQVILSNLDELLDCRQDLAAKLAGMRTALASLLASMAAVMAARKANGRVRECHGDLHMRNIVRWRSALLPFDCMEFEPAFRWIDVADEIAFLHMDLAAAGYAVHAHAFLSGYLGASGDYGVCRVLRLYTAHRALVRGKVAALGLGDAADEEVRATLRGCLEAYVTCAQGALETPRPTLILMRGLSGSGKTWLASRLASQRGAIHVRSDVERKRLAGLPELAASGSTLGRGLYTDAQDATLYRHLAKCAEDVLAGGYDAIVDATFLRRRDRDVLRAMAMTLSLRVVLVDCHAPREVLLHRISNRARWGHDASEADAQVLEYQESHLDQLDPGEFTVVTADTSRSDIFAEAALALHQNSPRADAFGNPSFPAQDAASQSDAHHDRKPT